MLNLSFCLYSERDIQMKQMCASPLLYRSLSCALSLPSESCRNLICNSGLVLLCYCNLFPPPEQRFCMGYTYRNSWRASTRVPRDGFHTLVYSIIIHE
ncbi:hypothetical protein PM082_004191 [Marasmius tenuissimus]|nr:hypothetical protein PM082_004191 [Marasmius tenuissimus]